MSVQSRSDGVNTSLFEKREHIEKLHRTRNLLRKVQVLKWSINLKDFNSLHLYGCSYSTFQNWMNLAFLNMEKRKKSFPFLPYWFSGWLIMEYLWLKGIRWWLAVNCMLEFPTLVERMDWCLLICSWSILSSSFHVLASRLS